MSSLKDILKANNGQLPDDVLMAYLEGKLNAEEQHEIEKWLAESGPESDALEGLSQIPADEVKNITGKLNYALNKELSKTKNKRKQPIRDNKWNWVAIIIILMLCIAGYVVLYMLAEQR